MRGVREVDRLIFRSLALKLGEARQNGGLVDVSSLARSLDVTTAYVIQHQLLGIGSETCVGYKIGATTKASIELLGLVEPFHGPLLKGHCHPSGCNVAIPPFQRVLVEAEIAVKLGEDLPPVPGGHTTDQISNAIEWIAPAIELCACRFNAELRGNGKLLIADGGINMDFVLGDQIAGFDVGELFNQSVVLQRNGTVVANGNSSVLLNGHPFCLVAWLANAPFLRDGGLRKGDIVSTGSCTGMTTVERGDQVTADFGVLGCVDAQFT